MRNGVHLIAYPDGIGGQINQLVSFLESTAEGLFVGVHLLPFYPSSADRGFAPLTYKVVDPLFGCWDDVQQIATQHDLTVDFMVNHISSRSEYFLDYLERGDASPWADLFLPVEKVAADGNLSAEERALIYTRKPRAPWIEVQLPNGQTRNVWCTFTEEQVDIDVNSAVGRGFIEDNLAFLCNQGAGMIRLDAFAYVTKRRGTSCFFVEPEVWQVLDSIRDFADALGVEVLPEIHEHYTIQLKLAERGYWVYDFALPFLMLHAIYSGRSERLCHWLKIAPRKQMTTLDTHDGIGVVDVKDLLSDEEIEFTSSELYKKGSNVNRRYSSAEYDNLDIYQINCTYYSALGNNDDSYILARAVQFFAPGIPQVYYVGALAGINDVDKIERTRHGRDINRHDYSMEEIALEVQRPVVIRLFALMRFRNSHPAFGGDLEVLPSAPHEIRLLRTHGEHRALLVADLASHSCRIEATGCDQSFWTP